MHLNQQLWEINAASSFSSLGQNMRSILKQPIPQRQMISIAFVRDIDHIFYRTGDIHENYEDVQRRINTVVRQDQEDQKLEEVDISGANVHMLYLLRVRLPVVKYFRVIIISSDSFQDGRIVVMADLIDVGSSVQLIEGLHDLFHLPHDLMYSKPTIAGPCRLLTDWTFDRDMDEDDEIKQLMNLTTLRNLLPADGVFVAEITELPSPPTEFNSQRNDNYILSEKAPQEDAMFYQPGSVQTINLVYQQMVQLQSTSVRNNFSSSQKSRMPSQSGGFNSSFRGAQGGFNSSARGSAFTSSFGRGGGGHGFGSTSRGGGGFGSFMQ